ncbi:MAG: hypothetical protein FWF54_08735 [Candidatus Azobacteroides sp.]|nr:hypothetical protein [Candidatus Azobacteroides sp.]
MIFIKIFVLILCAIIVVCHSCDRNKAEDIISSAEAVVSENPDSALLILQKIKSPENLPDSTHAHYWIVYGQADYNASRSMADDSMLLFSMKYYTDTKNVKKQIQSYRLAAQYKWWKRHKEDAYDLLETGLRVAESVKDTDAMVNLYQSLSNLSEKDYDIERSLIYTKKLIELDSLSSKYAEYYSDLGDIYFYRNQKDSSLAAFEKGLHIAEERKTTATHSYYNMLRDYADALNEFGESQKAIKYQKNALNFYIKNKYDEESLSYFSLSIYYLNIHQIDSADYYMNLAERSRPEYFKDDLALGNYYIVQRILLDYATKGRYGIRNIALFSNYFFADYMDKEKSIIEKSKTKLYLEQRNLNLKIEKQKTGIILLIISITLILTIGISFYSYRKKERKIIQKEEELETINRLLSTATNNNDKDNRFFKRILLQQLGIIRLAATSSTAQNQDFLQQMTRITNKDVPIDTLLVWDDLYQVIDSIYDSFYSKLIAKLR